MEEKHSPKKPETKEVKQEASEVSTQLDGQTSDSENLTELEQLIEEADQM